MSRYTEIPGEFTPRLPRVAKIHLGVMKKNEKGREYPAEVDYFVCPEEVQAIFGPKPKTLPVVLPVDGFEHVCPVAYKKYGAHGLACTGNGQEYTRWHFDDKKKEVKETQGECPTPEDCSYALDSAGRTVCKRTANIHVMIPEVSDGGTFQIDTSSYSTIASLRDCIFMARATRGSGAMQLLVARREENSIQSGVHRGSVHWPIRFKIPSTEQEALLLARFPRTRAFLDRFRASRLPAPAQPPLLGEIESHLVPRETVQAAVRSGVSTGDSSLDRMFDLPGDESEGTDRDVCFKCRREFQVDSLSEAVDADGVCTLVCEDCIDGATGAKPMVVCSVEGCGRKAHASVGECGECSVAATAAEGQAILDAKAKRTRKPRSDKGKKRDADKGAAKEEGSPPNAPASPPASTPPAEPDSPAPPPLPAAEGVEASENF